MPKTAAGNLLVFKGGTRRSRRILFDLRGVGWVPSSQDCQRGGVMHADCDVRSCGCRCHKVHTFYMKQRRI